MQPQQPQTVICGSIWFNHIEQTQSKIPAAKDGTVWPISSIAIMETLPHWSPKSDSRSQCEVH